MHNTKLVYELAEEIGLLVPDPEWDNGKADHRLKSRLINFAEAILKNSKEFELKDQSDEPVKI